MISDGAYDLCRKEPYWSRKAKPFLRRRANSTRLEWEEIVKMPLKGRGVLTQDTGFGVAPESYQIP